MQLRPDNAWLSPQGRAGLGVVGAAKVERTGHNEHALGSDEINTRIRRSEEENETRMEGKMPPVRR